MESNEPIIEFTNKSWDALWDIPCDCSGQILISGLSETSCELYYLLDFTHRQLHLAKIDCRDYRCSFENYWRNRISIDDLPYGVRDWSGIGPSFVQPHEGLSLPNGDIAMAMHNCGYIRVLNFADRRADMFPQQTFQPVMYSATNCHDVDGSGLVYAYWSLEDRLLRYKDNSTSLTVTVAVCDVQTGHKRVVATVETGECIHEVKMTTDGQYILLTEFCLNTPIHPPQWSENIFQNREAWYAYKQAGLFESRLYCVDTVTGKSTSVIPPRKTPGHVELSLAEPDVLYLSCHNLSKANGRVVLHGPGALLKYRICSGDLVLEAIMEAADLVRVTSHKVFEYQGDKLIAVTNYPNRLMILRDGSMEMVRDVTLFPCSSDRMEYLHFSELGQRVPIWLEISTDGSYVIVVANNCIYLYSLSDDTVREYSGYSNGEQFFGTGHLSNLEDSRRT